MLDVKLIQSLPQIPPPALTAYLDTNPAHPRNQGLPPNYLSWLKSQAKVLEEGVSGKERKSFREQVQRVKEYLEQNPPRAHSVVIFAGPQVWQFLALRVAVEDELYWGLPSLTQLLWLMDEHRPCGLVLVDRFGARFLRYWMGEMAEEHDETVKVDTTEWRRKDLMPPSQPDVEKLRGSHRDAFEHRVEAQYVRFYAREAEHIREWAERKSLNPVFLAGPAELVELVWAELPKSMYGRTVLIKEDLGHLTQPELHARIEPELKRWEREYQRALVDRLLDSGPHAVLGVEETLGHLQQGLVRGVAVVRAGLEERVGRCTKCGWTDRGADSVCAACGGERRLTTIRAVLPELVRRYKVPLEVVADEAGGMLRQAGGIGAWLKSSSTLQSPDGPRPS